MRKLDLAGLLCVAILLLGSCQREIYFPATPSEGSLQANGSGLCLPKSVNGTYLAGTALASSTNSINVDVNVTQAGTYLIYSDTINGYHFSESGVFSSTGIKTVTLDASGNPLSAGIDHFRIFYLSSTCDIAIEVGAGSGASGPEAVFTLANAPGNCTATIFGQYETAVFLDAANTVSISVNVSKIGTYSFSTVTVDGMKFSANGTFGGTGIQTIILNGNGIPVADGDITIPVTAGGTTCSFILPVGTGAALTADCASLSIHGTYREGVALTSDNFATIDVNVTIPGTYSISTNIINGIRFSGSGTLTPGVHTIKLTGSGTPLTQANTNVPIPVGCSIQLSIGPAVSGITYEWAFTVMNGTVATIYQGTTSDAIISFSNGVTLLDVNGTATTGNGTLNIRLGNTIGIISGANYSGTSVTGMFANFTFTDGGPINYTAAPTLGSNLPVMLTNYSTTSHLVEGTFSGTVLGAGGTTITITNGSFKAHLP